MNAFTNSFSQSPDRVDEDEGTGVDGKISPHMLKLVTSSQGVLLIPLPLHGGVQDDKCLTLIYHGPLILEGKATFRWWQIVVRGTGLEPLSVKIRTGRKQILKPGKDDKSTVTSIEVGSLEVEVVD